MMLLSATDNSIALDGYAFTLFDTQDAVVDALTIGEINFWRDVGSLYFTEIGNSPDIQSFAFNNGIYDYIGLNLANPNNPQPGMDENGNIIPQEPHPLFGDVRVRRAIQHAIDVDVLIEFLLDDYGSPVASYIQENSWAYNDTITPLPFDVDEANRLLDEAGWEMGENGIRVANDAQYAEDGTEFRFTLVLPNSTERRIAVAEAIQEWLLEIGIDMEIELQDFIVFLDALEAQTYDAYLLSWAVPFPSDPAPDFFIAEQDIIEDIFGLNLVSYHNEEVEKLNELMQTVPYCDPMQIALMSGRIQQILQEDNAYIWLYALHDMYAVSNDVSGFAPFPNLPLWNIEAWRVAD